MKRTALEFVLGGVSAVLVACGGSESTSTTPAIDAGIADAREDASPSITDAGVDADAEVDTGLACSGSADCPTGVCCRNVMPLGASECRQDCFTDAPRVQMCAPGESCQNGNACQAWPATCGAGPNQGYCESPAGYCP